jgi:hypothetical protein
VRANKANRTAKLNDPTLYAHGWPEAFIRREEAVSAVGIINGQLFRNLPIGGTRGLGAQQALAELKGAAQPSWAQPGPFLLHGAVVCP